MSTTRKKSAPHVYNPEEIGSDTIQFVDEGHFGNLVSVGLVPDCFRLRFHAADRTKNAYRTIQYT
jgi:hypothetical protein